MGSTTSRAQVKHRASNDTERVAAAQAQVRGFDLQGEIASNRGFDASPGGPTGGLPACVRHIKAANIAATILMDFCMTFLLGPLAKPANGKAIATLADARAYMLKLPADRAQRQAWQKTAELVLAAADGESVPAARLQLALALFMDGGTDPSGEK